MTFCLSLNAMAIAYLKTFGLRGFRPGSSKLTARMLDVTDGKRRAKSHARYALCDDSLARRRVRSHQDRFSSLLQCAHADMKVSADNLENK